MIIETIETHTRHSSPREARVHLDFLAYLFLHIKLWLGPRQTNDSLLALRALPDAPHRRRMDPLPCGQARSDVVNIPIVMLLEHSENDCLGLGLAAVPCLAAFRPGLFRQKSIDACRFVTRHPGVNGETTFLHGFRCVRDRNFAGEDTFNESRFHGCELVSEVGFHTSTLNDECVRLIAAIRTRYGNSI